MFNNNVTLKTQNNIIYNNVTLNTLNNIINNNLTLKYTKQHH